MEKKIVIKSARNALKISKESTETLKRRLNKWHKTILDEPKVNNSAVCVWYQKTIVL